MVDEATGEPWTAHTIIRYRLSWSALTRRTSCARADACDIVPTLIELMGLEKPKEMTENVL